ncbi:MAG: phosphoribosylanthranilate isomerase [Kofleriaceae bacterium]|jgi:phosphoribosylanthranilate isomerase|nr:phosphoribosylanthranilate isomerase [Kofleriaceae bacterium]
MALVRTKICGLTRVDDVEVVAAAGADFVGLNLWSGSKRGVTPGVAATLAAAARAAPRPAGHGPLQVVLLFVDAGLAELVAAAARCGADVVQLHGDETVAQVAAVRAALPTTVALWRALAVAGPADVAPAALAAWPVDALVLDAPSPGRGGSGRGFDWALAAAAVAATATPIVLAGGLHPGNVGAAITAARPWAVDVASGVEQAPGHKDAARVAAFVAAARAA